MHMHNVTDQLCTIMYNNYFMIMCTKITEVYVAQRVLLIAHLHIYK